MTRPSTTRLDDLESQYRELFIVALRACVLGDWGLFGHNDQVIARMNSRERVRHRNSMVEELLELGADIETMRQRLGIAKQFELHQRLLEARASANTNSLGEPKIAQRWLNELGA